MNESNSQFPNRCLQLRSGLFYHDVYVGDPGTVTRWNRDSTAILTYVRMNIDESLCGENADNEIIIQQIGGQVGTRSLKVLGTTTYKVGDENILFLFKDPTNTTVYQTVGLYQGKYRIFTDSRSVQRVAQDIDGKVILCKSSADAGVIETGNNLSLEEFKAKVKTYLSEQSK